MEIFTLSDSQVAIKALACYEVDLESRTPTHSRQPLQSHTCVDAETQGSIR